MKRLFGLRWMSRPSFIRLSRAFSASSSLPYSKSRSVGIRIGAVLAFTFPPRSTRSSRLLKPCTRFELALPESFAWFSRSSSLLSTPLSFLSSGLLGSRSCLLLTGLLKAELFSALAAAARSGPGRLSATAASEGDCAACCACGMACGARKFVTLFTCGMRSTGLSCGSMSTMSCRSAFTCGSGGFSDGARMSGMFWIAFWSFSRSGLIAMRSSFGFS